MSARLSIDLGYVRRWYEAAPGDVAREFFSMVVRPAFYRWAFGLLVAFLSVWFALTTEFMKGGDAKEPPSIGEWTTEMREAN